MKKASSWGYVLTKTAVKATSLLPLHVLYGMSDALAWILHSVVRYRRGVVARNLKQSFPEKDDKELASIARKYYRFMADVAVETIKMASMTFEQMQKHMDFPNVHVLNDYIAQGRSVAIFLGHVGNWEWVSSLTSWLNVNEECCGGQIYHRISNRALDRVMDELRSKWGGVNLEMDEAAARLIGRFREGKRSVIGYIADQVPSYPSIHCFTDFLNHPDTPVFTGAERIARITGAAAVYGHVRRTARGRYECVFEKISDNVADEPRNAVTLRYMQLLEEDIKRQPEVWLWSHRRWKRTIEEFKRLYGEKAALRLKH